ncbi:MAG: response regulator [Bryobacteraceae bacterium]
MSEARPFSPVSAQAAVSAPDYAERREAILVVSPAPEDHALLAPLLDRCGRKMYTARSYREAVAVLCRDRFSVVLCERDLPDGKWKDLLSQIAPLADPPCLIVISHAADEYLWAEVLNLGGYDVLAKPFDPQEVLRVVTLACDHWRRECQRSSGFDASPKPQGHAEAIPPQVFKTAAGR